MFKETLEGVMERAEGAIGALIMGTDGIAVESVLRPAGRDANLDVAAAEFTSIIRNSHRIGGDIGLGTLREITVTLDNAIILMRILNREYFLMLALKPEGNLGRGRFELRKAELQFAREFSI